MGDLLLDVVARAARAPERGTDVPGMVRLRAGGSAANTARAFVRAGGRASLVCAAGRDGLGGVLIAALREAGVTVHAVRVASPTGRLLATIEPGGERTFITERGAADALRPEDLRAAWFRGAGVLHLPAYAVFSDVLTATALAATSLARDAGALVSVDLASAGPIRALGRRVARERVAALAPDVLFTNREEAAALLGGRGGRRLPELLELARLVVVKEGADGCRILWRGSATGPVASEGGGSGAGSGSAAALVERLDVATVPIVAEDTTGAGDAFAAGMLHALLVTGEGAARPWSPALLRRAAVAGHRSAAELIRRPRPELVLGAP